LALTREEVLHIAQLVRLGLTDDDVIRFQTQLSQILEHFDSLSQFDTEGVPPTTHTLPLKNVTAPDQSRPSLTREEALANAPALQDGHPRIRAVLDE
jgi:aspartyl-tRNA(Asn)/glutamyl-tRNA(Gln) amidotransferase subunit C